MSDPATPTPISRHQRRKLRTSTTILPSTGERTHRKVTLPFFGWENESSDARGRDSDELPLYDSECPRPPRLSSFFSRVWSFLKRLLRMFRSRNVKLIFKCSVAYLLGSLCTFVPFISDWLGKHQHGKHMVATCTVYFHAARSLGSMMEATTFAFIAFAYSAVLALSSMGVSIFFAERDLVIVGHLVILFLFVGAGLGYVAWIKQRLGNPLVNVACSLTALCAITIFVREGSIQEAEFSMTKVIQVLKMIFLGITFAFLTNMIIFPEHAHDKLNEDLTEATDHLGALLTTITRAFLIGSEAEMQSKAFDDIMKAHKRSMASLKTNLAESKWEDYLTGREKRHHVESELVKCLQMLSQNVGALRSAAFMQFDLIRSTLTKDGFSPSAPLPNSTTVLTQPLTVEPESISTLGLQAINEEPESANLSPGLNESPAFLRSPSFAPLHGRSTVTPADMFSMFINQLGPPMRSLVTTLVLIMDELPFDSDVSDKIVVNHNFHASLQTAVELFKTARREALDALYRNKDIYRTHSIERLADYEEIAASCGHFSFALIDIAEEIGNYLDLLEDLKNEQDGLRQRLSFKWLQFWKRDSQLKVTKNPDDRLLHEPQRQHEDGPSDNMPQTPIQPPAKATAYPTIITTRRQRFFYSIWRLTMLFRRDDIRFAGKVGVGAALLAAPAFLESTRDVYLHYRMEWGLLSYMIVCSMTIGSVNTSSLERFVGTAIGALFAVLGWYVSDAQPVPLAAFGWAMSVWCFWIIVVMKRGPLGRFIFLTYNLSALYAYSLSMQDAARLRGGGDDWDWWEDDDEDDGAGNPHIWEIVLHRVMAVTLGCLWAIFVTRLVWPISARTKLKEGICLLWLRMALIWKRDPLSLVLLPSDEQDRDKLLDIREEAELRSFLVGLDSLRAAAEAEFELRGPFPGKAMAAVIERTGRMLDCFHGVNVAISKNLQPGASTTRGEIAVLRCTEKERALLAGRISHLFGVLASCLKMEFPLHAAVLPDIEHSRDRLLARVFEFRRKDDGRTASDVDFEMIYAYVLATGQLAKEISAIIKELELLYGTLNEDNFRFQ